jgi:hypothetical protein
MPLQRTFARAKRIAQHKLADWETKKGRHLNFDALSAAGFRGDVNIGWKWRGRG